MREKTKFGKPPQEGYLGLGQIQNTPKNTKKTRPNYNLNYLDPNFAVQNSKRTQSKFRVTLQFSCSESIQKLNNRSTQIIFFSDCVDIFLGAN